MRYFAYLRVSRDTQDVANQKLGLLEYANRRGFTPIELVEETASRSVPWRERALGVLLQTMAQRGDMVLCAEFTRLGGSPAQVFSILECAAERGISIVITKNDLVMDGSLHAQIQATAFALASMIETEFIRARTKEGLARARMEGRFPGRPKGSTSKLKLDPMKDQIGELYALGVSVPKLAERFSVTDKTMRYFVRRNFKTGD